MNNITRLSRDVEKLVIFLDKEGIKEPLFHNDDIFKFTISFNGPNDSFYRGLNILLHFDIPDSYPIKSPSLRFERRLYHPSVDMETGKVCIDILTSSNWNMSCTLVTVFKRVVDILINPDTDDPVNIDAYFNFKNNIELFKNLAIK